MVTASRIPVPEPMAPRKSANTDRAPMHKPPNAAAVGMYLEDKTPSQAGEAHRKGQQEAAVTGRRKLN